MSEFRQWVEQLAGEQTSAVKLSAIFGGKISDSTFSRRLKGESRPTADEIVTIAHYYSATPLFGLATFGYLKPDDIGLHTITAALRSAPESFLLGELLKRAEQREAQRYEDLNVDIGREDPETVRSRKRAARQRAAQTPFERHHDGPPVPETTD